MKKGIFTAKSKRNTLFAVITVCGIVLLFALNLILTYLGLNKTLFVDMTKEGFYTLTDKMVEQCSFVEDLKDENGNPKPVEITFCADPDTLVEATVMRTTYFMALKLAQRFDNIKVKTVNVETDPTAVAMYKTTSLTKISSSDVIVSFGSKYRIASAQSFWTTASDALWSYNGEYKMASIIMSLTAIDQPVAYFITGHDETVYDPDDKEASVDAQAIADLLGERGLAIKLLDLSSVDSVPEDCAILIINNPRKDFTYDPDKIDSFGYVSDLEKIDRYLTRGNGALMVAKDYGQPLPMLEAFLYEWGFEFSDTKVKDEKNSLTTQLNESFPPIAGVYETDENSYGNAIYGDYASSASAPKMIFTNTGYISCSFGLGESTTENGASNTNRHYAPFISTGPGANAYAYNADKGEYADLATRNPSTLALASVCSRHVTHETEATTTYSYVFCANSPDFLSNDLIGNPSYANFDMVSAVVNNIARTDMHASSDLGGTSLNSASFGGKQIIDAALYEYDTVLYSTDASNIEVIKTNSGITSSQITVISVLIYAVPVAIAAVGVVMCVKRRFL